MSAPPALQPHATPRANFDGDAQQRMETAFTEPVPTPASASGPATVSWVRWITLEEAQANIDVAEALHALVPTYCDARRSAALHTIRCCQMAKKEAQIPGCLKDLHWPDGKHPVPKRVLFASGAPIFRSGATVKTHIMAAEEATGVPYVAQAAGLLTTAHNDARAPHQPTAETREAVTRGLFVSRRAAAAAVVMGDGADTPTPGVPTAAGLPTATPTPGGSNVGGRKRDATTVGGTDLFGAKRAKAETSQTVDAYLDHCQVFGEEVDWKLVQLLHQRDA